MANETMDEIANLMEENLGLSAGKEKNRIVANHTGYSHKGSENFEHDDTGSIMNYSGVEDELNNAQAEHEDWQEGYDY